MRWLLLAPCTAVLRASPAMNLFSDLTRSISKSLQEVSVQHILVPTQLDANEIYNALVAGEAGVSSQRFCRPAAPPARPAKSAWAPSTRG